MTTLDPAMPGDARDLDAVVEAPEETPAVPEFSLLGLPRPLVSGLARAGIHAPFPIQRAAIPDILAGHDVLGRGQTGSGKTLAFGLPMMARIAGEKAQPRRPRAIILVPTRELALQVADALEPLGRGLSLRMKTVVGGMSMGKQIEALRRGVEVVVATPGRLTDLMEQGECSLEDVQVSILDEADHMCDLGFFPVVSAILEETPADGQRLLFSATLDGDVDKLVQRFLTAPVTHSLAPATSPVELMEHHMFQVTFHDKPDVTAQIAAREGRTIMFVRTQHGVDRVVKQLARVGVKAGGLHGGKRQNQRTRILGEFREGNVQVLVCTDVAARGIHVDDVSLVLHIDPPADHKSYLHRGGRTARAGERGSVVTLVMPNERRTTEAMARRAGINPSRHKVTPGDPVLAEIAGAQEPSGESIPVWEPDVRKPLRPKRDDRGPRGGFGDGERRPRRFGDRNRSDDFRRPAEDGESRRRDNAGPRGQYRDDRGPRTVNGDRPRENRSYDRSDRPFERAGDRPYERSGERSNDRPYGRSYGRDDRRGFANDRPSYDRPSYDRPSYDRPSYDRPAYDRQDRGDRPFSANRPAGRGRPFTGDRDGGRRFEDRGERGGYRGNDNRGSYQGGDRPRTETRGGWNGEGRSDSREGRPEQRGGFRPRTGGGFRQGGRPGGHSGSRHGR
ncbi:RNA helicase [Acrocarpospora phusangensis]|uniref:RNA helicase n=2 Tax=Acrocarpospora phusangensis TaxID=1070424 RepID=A0A919Q8Y6_9ACTN|nr:DEAD/DEAH box helicase [Acrocarpospora phusangensis]GIH24704.1 RNA helicase [Acrocarpospora phusangensis]